jgi:serine/threonine protein kinase
MCFGIFETNLCDYPNCLLSVDLYYGARGYVGRVFRFTSGYVVNWRHHLHVTCGRKAVLGHHPVSSNRWYIAVFEAKSHIPSRKGVIKQIRKGEVKFESETWKSISNDAKNFIERLLILNPAQRMTARAAAEHPFISRSMRLSILKPDPEMSRKVKSNLVRYAESTDFKKIALMVLAKTMNPEEILDLRAVFAEFDTSNDGTISFDEFKKALSQSHYSEQQLEHAFQSIVSYRC